MSNLNEFAYQQMIDEDIEAVKKYFPKHSLEKDHIIRVLEWSVKENYNHPKPIKKSLWNIITSAWVSLISFL